MNSMALTGDERADTLLSNNSFALLIGMLLDQQVALELAFAGPQKLLDRFGTLDARAIAEAEETAFAAVFSEKPSIHRFPGSMAKRVQALALTIADDWDGDAAALWERDNPNGVTVLRRLKALPGFGEQKAKIFLALLGKQRGFGGEGWREASRPYGEVGSYRSVADIVDADSLLRVREAKRAAKAAATKG